MPWQRTRISLHSDFTDKSSGRDARDAGKCDYDDDGDTDAGPETERLMLLVLTVATERSLTRTVV